MHTIQQLSPHGHAYFVFNIVTAIIASLAVSLRIWVRLRISKSLGAEDILLLFSTLFFICLSICGIIKTLYGFGGHQDAIELDDLKTLYKFMYTGCIFIYLCTITLRLSLCLLFLRITTVLWQRRTIYGIAIATTIVNLFNLVRLNIFFCVPVSAYWNVLETSASCISPNTMIKLLYLQYSLATAADWVSSLLPIFMLRDWTSNDGAKRITYVLLGMGIFASGASIATIVLTPTSGNNVDYTFTAFHIFIAQITEAFIGILAASFSTYRPLFRRLQNVTQSPFQTTGQRPLEHVPDYTRSCYTDKSLSARSFS